MLQDLVRQMLGVRSDEIGRRSADVILGNSLPLVVVNTGFWDGSHSTLQIDDLTGDPRFNNGMQIVFLTLDGKIIDPMVRSEGDGNTFRALDNAGGVELDRQLRVLLAAGEKLHGAGYLMEPRLPGVMALVGEKKVIASDRWNLLGLALPGDGQWGSVMDRGAFETALANAIAARKLEWAKAQAAAHAAGRDPNTLGS